MGGMTVLGIACKYPDKVRGVVSFNGSGDWGLTHLFIQARFGVNVDRNWVLEDVVDARSPVNNLEHLADIPILMTNGESDISIDPRAQAHFYENLMQVNHTSKRITYPLLGQLVTTNMMDDAISWMDEVSARK